MKYSNHLQLPDSAQHLKKTYLFAELELHQLEQLAGQMSGRTYRPGELIYRIDDPADAIFVVCSGTVKISKLFPNGKEAILEMMGAHDIFGELLLPKPMQRLTQAEALQETQVLVLPIADLHELLTSNPDLAVRFINILTTRLFEAQSWSATVTAYSATERLASLLARLGREFGRPHPQGTELSLRLNQEDLARMVGTTRETVSHSLQKLRLEGAIIRQRAPFVLQIEQLEAYAEG